MFFHDVTVTVPQCERPRLDRIAITLVDDKLVAMLKERDHAVAANVDNEEVFGLRPKLVLYKDAGEERLRLVAFARASAAHPCEGRKHIHTDVISYQARCESILQRV